MANLWYLIIADPVLNALIALSHFLFDNFGLGIVAFTIIIRLALWPLTKRQFSSTKALQNMQPKMLELQKKYGKNQQRLQQEMMKLYREAGINPLGCLWPLLVQFPIWIALYQAITRALGTTPENLLELAHHLYSWKPVTEAIPLSSRFLWLDLGQPDHTLILALIVGVTTWVQQKMTTPPSIDPRQQATNNMMLLMMPFMFGLFTLMFPSGLPLYWAASNIIGIISQYLLTGGWGYLRFRSPTQSVSVKTRKS